MLNKKALVSILVVSLCSILFANSSFIYDAQELKTMGKLYKLTMPEEANRGWYLDKDGLLTKQIEVMDDKSNVYNGKFIYIPKKVHIRNTQRETDYQNPVNKSILIVNKGMYVSALEAEGESAKNSISDLGSIDFNEMSNLLGFQVNASKGVSRNIAKSFKLNNVPYRGHIEVYPVYEHYDFSVYMKARRGLKNWTPILDGYGKRVVGFEAKFVRDTFWIAF